MCGIDDLRVLAGLEVAYVFRSPFEGEPDIPHDEKVPKHYFRRHPDIVLRQIVGKNVIVRSSNWKENPRKGRSELRIVLEYRRLSGYAAVYFVKVRVAAIGKRGKEWNIKAEVIKTSDLSGRPFFSEEDVKSAHALFASDALERRMNVEARREAIRKQLRELDEQSEEEKRGQKKIKI